MNQCLPDTKLLNRHAEQRASHHGAKRQQAHHIAIDQATVFGWRQIDDLLRRRHADPAPEAKQYAIPQHQHHKILRLS